MALPRSYFSQTASSDLVLFKSRTTPCARSLSSQKLPCCISSSRVLILCFSSSVLVILYEDIYQQRSNIMKTEFSYTPRLLMSHLRGSNSGPQLYESCALPTELRWQKTIQILEPLAGIEPATSFLPRTCST